MIVIPSFFPYFLLNRHFGGFFPLSSGFQRVNEGNDQDVSFFSPQQCLKFLTSLAETLKYNFSPLIKEHFFIFFFYFNASAQEGKNFKHCGGERK